MPTKCLICGRENAIVGGVLICPKLALWDAKSGGFHESF